MTGDASDRVALVTGSTDGIGREIARRLAIDGGTVLLHGRDREKGREAVTDIAEPAGNADIALYCADFADFGAVRDLARAVREDHGRLDVLVNNAGTWQGRRRLVDVPGTAGGANGIELTFVVNHLAPFLLTHYLLEPLESSGTAAEAGGGDPARIVTVASDLHRRATLNLDAVRGPDGPTGIEAYALSKLANVSFTRKLARRAPDGVTAASCHPGIVPRTAIDRGSRPFQGLGWNLLGLVGRVVPGLTATPAEAAETPVSLARSLGSGGNGRYFSDCEPVTPSPAARDPENGRELWTESERLVDLDASLALSTSGERGVD